jgi:hypothetical protein
MIIPSGGTEELDLVHKTKSKNERAINFNFSGWL